MKSRPDQRSSVRPNSEHPWAQIAQWLSDIWEFVMELNDNDVARTCSYLYDRDNQYLGSRTPWEFINQGEGLNVRNVERLRDMLYRYVRDRRDRLSEADTIPPQ